MSGDEAVEPTKSLRVDHLNPETIEGYVGTRCQCGFWFDTGEQYREHLKSLVGGDNGSA